MNPKGGINSNAISIKYSIYIYFSTNNRIDFLGTKEGSYRIKGNDFRNRHYFNWWYYSS